MVFRLSTEQYYCDSLYMSSTAFVQEFPLVKYLVVQCLGHRLFECYVFLLVLALGQASAVNHLSFLSPYVPHLAQYIHLCRAVEAFSPSMLPFFHQQYSTYSSISSLFFPFSAVQGRDSRIKSFSSLGIYQRDARISQIWR